MIPSVESEEPAGSSIGPTPEKAPSSTSLRDKVTGILANTANGCLDELGYRSGVLGQSQEVERIKKENHMLLEDNITLHQQKEAADAELNSLRHELEVRNQILQLPEHAIRQRLFEVEQRNASLKQLLDAPDKSIHQKLLNLRTRYELSVQEGQLLLNLVTKAYPDFHPHQHLSTQEMLPNRYPAHPHPTLGRLSERHSPPVIQQVPSMNTQSQVLQPGPYGLQINTQIPQYLQRNSAPASTSAYTYPVQQLSQQHRQSMPTGPVTSRPSSSSSQHREYPNSRPPSAASMSATNGYANPYSHLAPPQAPNNLQPLLYQFIQSNPQHPRPQHPHPNPNTQLQPQSRESKLPVPHNATPQGWPQAEVSISSDTNVKRMSAQMDSSSVAFDAHKRPRIDVEPQANAPLTAAYASSPVIIQLLPPQPTQPVLNPPDEIEDDEIVEVGKDGLKTYQYTVDQLYEDDEDDENIKTCRICDGQYRSHPTECDPPVPFSKVSYDTLLAHLLNEHPAAVDKFRGAKP